MTEKFELPIRYSDGPFGRTIPYELRTDVKAQSRKRYRAELTPLVNLSDYTTRAVFDWIEVQVFLGRETTWQSVQNAVEKHYARTPRVTGPNGETRYKGHQFRIRLHDPVPRVIEACMDEIESRHGFVCRPELASIEISLDWYAKSGRAEDRDVMVGLLQRHFLPPQGVMERKYDQARCFTKVGDVRRTYRILEYSDSEAAHPELDLDYDEAPRVDGTTYFCGDDAPVLWRIMHKVRDCQKPAEGEYIDLTEKQSRARIEICLREKPLRDLGLKTIDDLRGFNFDTLRTTHFNFKLATVTQAHPKMDSIDRVVSSFRRPLEMRRFISAGVYGVDVLQRGWLKGGQEQRENLRGKGLRRRRRKQPIFNNGLTVAYEEMNRRVQNAFARLKWCP